MLSFKPRNVALTVLAVVSVVAAGLVIAQDQDTLRVQVPVGAEDPQFPDYLALLLGHPLTRGDSFIVHTDGPAAFGAMLASIAGAKFRISFETYIFDAGEVGKRFADAFAAAASRGVEVRIVLDAVGAGSIDEADLKRMKDAGCEVGLYNEIDGYSFEEANYRTHRKVLVVDGDVGFVGGIGLADQWARDIDGAKMWRDTHVELRGRAAVNVEAGFYENWIETGGVVAPDLLTHPEVTGDTRSTVVWSSPAGGANEMTLLYLLAIASARRTLDIQSPYVVTDESTRWSLADARRRGVRVRILMEGDVTDAKPVKFASRGGYGPLLAQGVELYEYQPAMMHTKAMIVDGVLSVFGSANFDNRSLELNDELNVAAFDRGLAARLLSDFERDLKRSSRIDAEEWRSRPFHIRAREKGWSLFGEVF